MNFAIQESQKDPWNHLLQGPNLSICTAISFETIWFISKRSGKIWTLVCLNPWVGFCLERHNTSCCWDWCAPYFFWKLQMYIADYVFKKKYCPGEKKEEYVENWEMYMDNIRFQFRTSWKMVYWRCLYSFWNQNQYVLFTINSTFSSIYPGICSIHIESSRTVKVAWRH